MVGSATGRDLPPPLPRDSADGGGEFDDDEDLDDDDIFLAVLGVTLAGLLPPFDVDDGGAMFSSVTEALILRLLLVEPANPEE